MVFSGQSKLKMPKLRPTPFLAIFEADLESQVRSRVVVALFVIMLFIGILFAVASSAADAKVSISSNLSLFIYLWSLPIIALSAGAVSSESGAVADSVLSKSVKRYEYTGAKLCARLTFNLTTYFIVMIVVSLVALRVSPTGAIRYAGWLVGIFSVALVIAGLTIMSVMFSTITSSTVVSVILSLLTWYSMLIALPLAGMNDLSPNYITGKMPDIMCGFWDKNLSEIAGLFAGIAVLSTLVAVWYFETKDLGSD